MKTLLSVLIFCLTFYFVAGQTTPKEKLNSAIYLEEVKGELEEAIKVYETIVKDFPNEREYAAKAQLHIGLCYEKLGKQQATEAYNKVIEQFADQQQTAEMAKTRLKNLNSQVTSVQKNTFNPKITQIHFEHKEILRPYSYQYLDFSPDGKNFVFTTYYKSENDTSFRGRVFLADISGAPVKLLIEPSPFYHEGIARFSPDSRYVDFVADRPKGLIGIYDFRTEEARILIKLLNPRPGRAWHPDGKHLCSATSTGIITFNLSGEITDSIPLKMTETMALLGYSHDGNWIAYQNRLNRNNNEVEIRLVSSTGDKNVFLTNSIASGMVSGIWSENGYYFYFIIERDGDQNIFRLKIDPETGNKIGEPEQITNYYNVNIFNPRYIKEKSALAYVVGKKQNLILTSDVDNPGKFKTVAVGEHPQLSPDGETIYFATNKGIYSISRTGINKKRLTDLVPTSYYGSSSNYHHFALSNDGNTIAFFTRLENDDVQLCFLSSDGKKLYKSVILKSTKLKPFPGWSPDDKKVAYCADKQGVFVLPAWSNTPEKLVGVEHMDPNGIPRWSPDGKYIACFVRGEDEKESIGIKIVSTQTKEVKKLTPKTQTYWKECIDWHPNSKKLAYMYYDPAKDEDGIWEAYLDGSPPKELINQEGVWDYWGKYDPSGKNYYFYGNPKDEIGWHLYKYNIETKKISVVIKNNPTDLDFFFSKDGKYMVIEKSNTENQLWMIEGVE